MRLTESGSSWERRSRYGASSRVSRQGLRDARERACPLRTSWLSLPPMRMPTIAIGGPGWVDEVVGGDRRYVSDEQRMRVAIELSRQNVVRGTGGPFGAVIVESESGRLIAVGMNSVVRLNNCTLHGEMVAIMMAQARL